MTDPKVRAFLAALRPHTKGLVQALRNVVRRNFPQAKETLLWGGISYHRPEVGGRVKGAICQIEVKGADLRLGFIHGVRLPDPQGLLTGTGVSKRFVLIETLTDAERPEVIALLREAAALDPTGWT